MSFENQITTQDGNDHTFDTNDMDDALSEILKPKPEQKFSGAPSDAAEAEDKARAYNWPAKIAYDYTLYNADKETPPHNEMPTWASSAVKYEWNDDFGDVPPRLPELEAQLFNLEFLHRPGTAMLNLGKVDEVMHEGPKEVKPVLKFVDAGLHPIVMETLGLMNYDVPTPIQAFCIPAILLGHDVVATAQTGSGKTGAYMIPIISRLMGKWKKLAARRPNTSVPGTLAQRVRAEPLVLIVAPTRELVAQIFDEARRLCYRTMLRPCVAYGGGPSGIQREEMQKGCDLLIATPGRLVDFLKQPSLLSLSRVKYTIIDEADELLTPDWEDAMNTIMTGGDNNEDPDHVFMMFSATFPKEMRKIARKYMEDDYFRIRVGRIGATHRNITQTIVYVDEALKRDALYDLLFSKEPSRTMIFVNSKRQADMIDDFLFNKGLPSTSIHADRTQREREDAILAFKHGTCPLLVTTGISARGIDIKNVMHVINYDMPSYEHGGIQEYVHRIGRTARIGHEGLATSFYNDRNSELAEDLVKLLMENEQIVPDFLEEFKPTDGALNFADESEPDSDNENGGIGAGDAEKNTGGGWGSTAKESSGGGWGDAQKDSSGGDPAAKKASGGGWGAAETQSGGWGATGDNAW